MLNNTQSCNKILLCRLCWPFVFLFWVEAERMSDDAYVPCIFLAIAGAWCPAGCRPRTSRKMNAVSIWTLQCLDRPPRSQQSAALLTLHRVRSVAGGAHGWTVAPAYGLFCSARQADLTTSLVLSLGIFLD
jgi:hypothetical protein